MFRFLLAVIRAVLAKCWQGMTAAANWMDGLFGGSSNGTIMPPNDIALPDEDEIEVAKWSAKSEAIARNSVHNFSSALQAFKYASTEASDRYNADLNLLGPAQKCWLRGLPEDALRTVASADLKAIDRALKGEHFALPGIDSVAQDSPRADNAFAERLRLARALATRDLDYVRTP